MDHLIISCRTLENELRAALPSCAGSYDLVWFDSRLHNVKRKLHDVVQEFLNSADGRGYRSVLMATGFCGNAVLDLRAGDAPLVIPRVDDCISLLLGSVQQKHRWLNSYFLTEGWLKGGENIWNEYQRSLQKYGEEKTEQIFRIMLANYRRLTLLDTGCYDLEACGRQAREIAEKLALELTVAPASVDYLRRLLTGPWDEEHFLIVPPHGCITSDSLARIC